MPITNSLKKIRTERHVNQIELANAIGSCTRTISRIEKGERNASLELAIKISKYFNLPVEEVFDIE